MGSDLAENGTKTLLLRLILVKSNGGERGIRTLETVSRLHTFQACAFDHSATSPACHGEHLARHGADLVDCSGLVKSFAPGKRMERTFRRPSAPAAGIVACRIASDGGLA